MVMLMVMMVMMVMVMARIIAMILPGDDDADKLMSDDSTKDH